MDNGIQGNDANRTSASSYVRPAFMNRYSKSMDKQYDAYMVEPMPDVNIVNCTLIEWTGGNFD